MDVAASRIINARVGIATGPPGYVWDLKSMRHAQITVTAIQVCSAVKVQYGRFQLHANYSSMPASHVTLTLSAWTTWDALQSMVKVRPAFLSTLLYQTLCSSGMGLHIHSWTLWIWQRRQFLRTVDSASQVLPTDSLQPLPLASS